MAIDEQDFVHAEKRGQERRRSGYAVAARYDAGGSRVIVSLNNGLELAFPPALAEGLAGASPKELAEIEITPSGLGLHWPRLDADVYLPALLRGIFGSRRWMAAQPGSHSAAKTLGSRTDDRKNGRPRVKGTNAPATR
jgi:hypothetical protein